MMSSVAVLLVLLAYGHAIRLAKQECASSGDCPYDKVCSANLCEDPCPGFCGENTECQVKWHTPTCRCRQGYNGDPMQGCTEAALQECSFNGDCPLDKACEKNMCEDPCTGLCGNNTMCEVKRHMPVCRCRQGFTGEPMLGCTESVIQECSFNGECPLDNACEQHKCEDPCLGFCGNNTVCQVKRHVPVCSCLQGFIGEPMLGCTESDCKSQNTTETTGKKKFEISTLKLNWYGAFMNCQTRGMRMATIENQEQDKDFIAFLKSKGLYLGLVLWVGATDLMKEGDWYWMTTGQSISKYKNWFGDEPSNGGGENCMGYLKYNGEIAWCDFNCTNARLFACEYY